MVLTIITLFILQPYAQKYWQRPSIKIIGALPLHIFEQSSPQSPVKFHHHALAFILKVENDSPTPALIHAGLIDGCVKMNEYPEAAEISLPPERRVSFDGQDITFGFTRHKNTVQRLNISGGFLDPSTLPAQPTVRVLIPIYATEYIGVQFNQDESGAFWSHERSISLSGNCSEIQYPNRRASYLQLLQPTPLYQSTSLRPEFTDGRLTILLIAGNQQLPVNPRTIKPIYALRKENWPRLSLPQMYENPQSDFPPLVKEFQAPERIQDSRERSKESK
jgi:hypothetical protein